MTYPADLIWLQRPRTPMAWKKSLILAFAQACFTDGMIFFFSRHKTAISSSQRKIWKRHNKKGEWNTKGICKRKISFLIPLAFSFRAVNTVLWKVNIDQHDTSVEQRQNLSTCLGLNPWPLERWEVMGPIPVGDSDFVFVQRSCHVDQFTRHISLPSLKFTIFFSFINTVLSQLFTRWSITREKWCFLLVTENTIIPNGLYNRTEKNYHIRICFLVWWYTTSTQRFVCFCISVCFFY